MARSAELEKVRAAWEEKWPAALALWSRFTRLRPPRWCFTTAQEKTEQLTGSFAMIRFADQAIVVSLRQTTELKLNEYALEILAHEIGHHMYCPADLTDHGRMLIRMRRALPTKEHLAPFIANLYADLLINNRLERQYSLRISEVYQVLGKESGDPLWTLYMRVYEILWSRPKSSLAPGKITAQIEGDAQLGARIIKVFAKDWLLGAGKFAALCLPYLLKDEGAEVRKILAIWEDTRGAGSGGLPEGLTEIEEDELTAAEHPANDRRLTGLDEDPGAEDGAEVGHDRPARITGKKTYRKYREPGEYGEILKSLGIDFDEKLTAIAYYRERARRHLIKFPEHESNESTEPLPEGVEPWDASEPLSEIDWFESIVRSPHVIPGVTTVKRTFGVEKGQLPEKSPAGLYVGIDCSGSMPNPKQHISFPALAGTVLALSALRAGAPVKVVLSGEPGRSTQTNGFVRSEQEVMSVLVDYLGTGYAFGIHRLAETFSPEIRLQFPVHIVIITDTDIFSMLEGKGKLRGRESSDVGWKIAADAARICRGSANYVMNVPDSSYRKEWPSGSGYGQMIKDGWNLHFVATGDEVVEFARKFSAQLYEKKRGK
jgi:hypothetical protein